VEVQQPAMQMKTHDANEVIGYFARKISAATNEWEQGEAIKIVNLLEKSMSPLNLANTLKLPPVVPSLESGRMDVKPPYEPNMQS